MSSDATPSPAPRAFDAAALMRLRELDPDGRLGVLPRVLGAFESSLARMLDEIRGSGPAVDGALVFRVAHKLRSSAAAVGALDLAQACAETERRLREDPGAPFAPEAERLLREGSAALAVVAAMLRP